VTSSPSKIWRLIVTPPLSGAENMAVDEALLRCFDPVSSLPVLRLYGWSPPTLSLGRFQKATEELDLIRCRTHGVPLVRRITGGGVIYHADELTYSLVCSPEQIPPAASIKDSFRVLTGFLLSFYRGLGLEAGYAQDTLPSGTRLGERTAFCFAGRESFDILINGRKVGGNAQRRTKGVIFQHGSIPLINRVECGLSYMLDQPPGMPDCVVSLSECGINISPDRLSELLTASFEKELGVVLQDSSCSSRERASAEELTLTKYMTDRWNLEGVGE